MLNLGKLIIRLIIVPNRSSNDNSKNQFIRSYISCKKVPKNKKKYCIDFLIMIKKNAELLKYLSVTGICHRGPDPKCRDVWFLNNFNFLNFICLLLTGICYRQTNHP